MSQWCHSVYFLAYVAEALPMDGGSDRYRHWNNYDPFYVTITTSAKKGYVIAYLDVTATVANGGEVNFSLVRGSTGTRTMVFQLVSNHSEFLSYRYLSYGITEQEYKKMANIITIPVGDGGIQNKLSSIAFLFLILHYIIYYFYVLL
ncbi:hypothetical protein ACJJTC_014003 [Scirpophaga incertulas]